VDFLGLEVLVQEFTLKRKSIFGTYLKNIAVKNPNKLWSTNFSLLSCKAEDILKKNPINVVSGLIDNAGAVYHIVKRP
jgi:hypothetical protein